MHRTHKPAENTTTSSVVPGATTAQRQRAHAMDGTKTAVANNPLWRLKTRLQFTGWLQYVLPLAPAALLTATAGAAAAITSPKHFAARVPAALAGALSGRVMYDIATAKWGMHPAEARPATPHFSDDLAVIKARRSCRSFQKGQLTSDDRDLILRAATENSQPKNLLGDGPIRFEYISQPLTVWPVVGAHEFIAAIAPAEYNRTAVIDIGRSLQRTVLAATKAGISTCWIGPGADQSSIVAALGDRYDPDRDHVVCVCAIGYASRHIPLTVQVASARMRQRKPLAHTVFQDAALGTPADLGASAWADLSECFEAGRRSPSSYNAQPTRAIVQTSGESRRVIVGQGFASRYYAPIAIGTWLANWETACSAIGIEGTVSINERDAQHWTSDAFQYGATWTSHH